MACPLNQNKCLHGFKHGHWWQDHLALVLLKLYSLSRIGWPAVGGLGGAETETGIGGHVNCTYSYEKGEEWLPQREELRGRLRVLEYAITQKQLQHICQTLGTWGMQMNLYQATTLLYILDLNTSNVG